MANELTIIREAWVHQESTFSTDPDSDGSDYARIPGEGIEWAPSWDVIEREVQRDGLGKSVASQPGGKGGTLTMRTPLVGLTTAAASTVQAVPPVWLSRMLQACGLTEQLGTGTVVSGAGSTTTVIDVSAASGIAVGSAVLIAGEVRQVTARDTVASPNTITVAPALSSAPGNGVVVYSGAHYVIDQGVDSGITAAFAVKLHNTEETLLGCKGTFSVPNVNARERPMFDWSFQIDSWADTTNKSSLPTALGLQKNVLAMGAPVWFGGTKTPVSSLTFDPALGVSPKLSTQGTQGRAGWVVTSEASVLGCTPYLDQSNQRTRFSTPTLERVIAQIGSAHTETVAICGDQAQSNVLPDNADLNGLRGHTLSFRFRESAFNAPHFVLSLF